ncbi:MAG: bis(5'-nucleosyl)-tetraphosphatase (symmetrical) YqeK [Eubacteriales bacterium]|nr:bis(5'-nucleosyl)-tetraphosphatase (symmetrical) YqeK [Eubacteriales bacterium]
MRDKIIEFLKENLIESRFTHTMGVCGESMRLAEHYGVDINRAELAALMHDCLKNKTDQELISIAQELGVKLDEIQLSNGKLLHAPVGAAFAKEYFNIEDSEIIDAVVYHTTGKADMTLLEKIIYLADYIEPNRQEFDGLSTLRDLAYTDIDKAVLSALETSAEYVESKGSILHPDTIAALNWLKDKEKEKERGYYMTTQEALKVSIKALDDKKAKDIQAIKLADITSVADYFVICTATSSTHAKTLADEIEDTLEGDTDRIFHKEGYRDTAWILLDYGDIVFHIFYGESRDFYNLEHLWADGEKVDVSKFLA